MHCPACMPRKRFIPSNSCPYNISARCHNREWFELPMNDVWQIFSDYLYCVHHAFDLQIHSFVLMSNHFHLIASTPNNNLPEVMNYFMREVSKSIARRTERINQIFGGPYHWSLLNSNHYYLCAYKYLYRNPVDAGLCEKVEDYIYSSLPGLLGNQRLIIPIKEDHHLFRDPEETLKWLNSSYPRHSKDEIKKALRRNQFAFSRTHKGFPNPLEFNLV